jgi:hypothetical protein
MPSREYAVDGDEGFIGLNSRDNPVNLGKNFVSKAQNIRMDRGVATVRKGAERLTAGALVGESIFGACAYTTATGTELIVLAVSNGLFTYNPDTEALSAKVNFPSGETITGADEVELYQAQGVGYVYILRGFAKTVLRWNGTTTIVIPDTHTHTGYPNSRHAIYYGNRHIVQTDRNTISVSHYLEDNHWSALDVFTINDGSSDTLVAISPWTLNEFVIFMRNSIFYASAGVGANSLGDAVTDDNSYIKSLASDIGCIAKGSIVQAGGGILFLSDNGVYILNPAGAGNGAGNTPEGMRLLTIAEPLSAPISDVIDRINFNAVDKAVATYFENRYYLSVPLDNSEVNNAVLVYNFINKAWESVDTYPENASIENSKTPDSADLISTPPDDEFHYILIQKYGAPFHGLARGDYVNCNFGLSFGYVVPSGTYKVTERMTKPFSSTNFTIEVPRSAFPIDPWTGSGWLFGTFIPCTFAKSGTLSFMDFVVAKKDKRRRLFMVNDKQGVFLLEELNYDEFGLANGTPVLPFFIPTELNPLSFTPIQIDAQLTTRAYSFQTNREKRFSSIQADVEFPAGGALGVSVITVNPDSDTLLNSYGSSTDEDATLRFPVRKSGYYAQVKFNSLNLRPSVRSVTVQAIVPGQMTQTTK